MSRLVVNLNEGSSWRRGWPVLALGVAPLFVYLAVYVGGRYRRFSWRAEPNRRQRIRHLSKLRLRHTEADWERMLRLIFQRGWEASNYSRPHERP